jgi:hypothetical protein
MATNPVTIFDPTQMPAHVKAAQAAGTSNIVTRAQVNSLTFPGKVWTVNIDGSKKPLMRVNADGEEELIQAFDAVIIAYNENKGRSYYGGRAYDPGQEMAPVCWSNDGVTSSPNSPERQSEKCNVCPQAVKGSRQTDQGKAATACAVHRNLAIVPKSRDLSTAPVLRLKIPQTSDFDGLNKEAQAKMMFAFQNYLNFLKSKSVPFTYSLTTKIRFDNSKSYPKLWFSPGRWLTEEETAACAGIAESGNLDDLLRTDFSGFGNAGARPPGITEEDEQETDDDDGEMVLQQPARPAAPAPAPAPAPAAATAATAPASAKAKAAAQKKAEAAAAAAAARKAAVMDDEDEAPAVAIAAGRAPASAPAASAPPQLDTILKDWDDE